MQYVGLLGKNISYSKSPDIHNQYYYETGIELEYKIFDIDDNNISTFIKNLRINKVVGFNVTIPYKSTIIQYLDIIEPPADEIGAINTVLVTDEKLIGFNTDYYGFIKSLKVFGFSIRNKNALIIGDGGSAKCIYRALRDLDINNIHVISRNTIKSKVEICGADHYLSLKDYYGGLSLEPYDMVINCTPIGGGNHIEDTPFHITKIKPTTLVYDLNYSAEESRLLHQAKEMGAQVMNGSLMLKYQAIKAMNIWIGYINERGK